LMYYEYLSGNKEWLLQSIDQMLVWSSIVGYSVNLEQKILNPLRNDKRLGSCYLKDNGRNIILIDHADSKTSGYDCVTAYRYLNPNRSWSEVCSDLMNIGHLPISSYRVLPGVIKPK